MLQAHRPEDVGRTASKHHIRACLLALISATLEPSNARAAHSQTGSWGAMLHGPVGGRISFQSLDLGTEQPKLAGLNQLLAQLVIDIGDLPMQEIDPGKFIPSTIDLYITAAKCRDFQLGSLQIDAQKLSGQDVEVTIYASNLAIKCACNWKFHYIAGGEGTATAWASADMGNSLRITFRLHSGNLATTLPTIPAARIPCTLHHGGSSGEGDGWYVHLDKLQGTDITGSLGDTVANEFRDDITGAITKALGSDGAVCNSIGSSLPSLLEGVISTLDNITAPVFQNMNLRAVSRATKLVPERLLNHKPVLDRPLNLRENSAMSLIKIGSDQLASELDAGCNSSKCYTDFRGGRRCRGPLLINSLIEPALGENGTLLLTDQLNEILGGNTSFSVSSDIVTISVDLISVQLSGLNSFSVFDAFDMIGNETTSLKVALQYIGLAIRICIKLRAVSQVHAPPPTIYLSCPVCSQVPCSQCQEGCSAETCGNSSVRNSCPANNNGQHPTFCTHSQVNEDITVHTDVDSPALELAALLGLILPLLDAMPLGDMISNPLPCLLSVVATRGSDQPNTRGLNLTYLNATINNISHPVLAGFVDGGTDEIANSMLDAAFLAYEEVFINGLPGYMHETLRPIVNAKIESYLSESEHVKCPSVPNIVTPSTRFVDFRHANLSSVLPSWAVHEGRCEPPCTAAWIINNAIGVENMNSAIGQATKTSSGHEGTFSMAPASELFKFEFSMKPNIVHLPPTCITCWRIGDVSFWAGNLSISGLNTISTMDLLEPSLDDPYFLHNELQMDGTLDRSAHAPLQLQLDVAFSIEGKEDHEVRKGISDPESSPDKLMHLNDRFTIRLTLEQVEIMLDMLIMIDHAQLLEIKVGLLNDVTQYLGALAALRPQQMKVAARHTSLAIECHHCSSPLLSTLSTNLNSADAAEQLSSRFNSFWSDFAKHFVDDSAVQRQYEQELSEYYAGDLDTDIKEVCEGEVPQSTAQCGMWERVMQCKTNRAWMSKRCPVSCGLCPAALPRPEPEAATDGLGALSVVLIICGVLTGLAFAVLCCRSLMCRRGGKFGGVSEMVITEPGTSTSTSYSRSQVSHKTDTKQAQKAGSLIGNPYLPIWLRYGVPLTLCANIALFVSGHLEIGSTVDLSLSVMGEHVRSDRFVEFSLGHSLADLWNAEAYILFYMVGGFSGVWPYGKLLLLLFCWVSPSNCLNVKRRESWLMKCEAAGTWSFMDMYLLVMCILGFSIHVASPNSMPGVLPNNFYVLDGILTPVWGLYGFVLGIMLSIAVNYVMLQAHRHALRREAKSLTLISDSDGLFSSLLTSSQPPASQMLSAHTDGDDALESLCNHDFDEDSDRGAKYSCTALGRRVVLGLLISAGLLICWGGFLPSFGFRTFGIAGALVDFGNAGAADTSYSLLSSTAAVIRQAPARYGGWFGLVFIAVVYVGFAWVVPLAVVGVAVAQFWMPLTLRRQRQLESVAEALRAWSALFVFTISIAIAVQQIEQVSSFMVGNPCRKLGQYFQDLAAYNLLEEQFFPSEMQHHKYCFVVQAYTRYGLAVLLLGGCISTVACWIVSTLTLTAIAERGRRSSPEAQAAMASRTVVLVTRTLPETTKTVAGQIVSRKIVSSYYTRAWRFVAKASGCTSRQAGVRAPRITHGHSDSLRMDQLPMSTQQVKTGERGLAVDSAEFQALGVVAQLKSISSTDPVVAMPNDSASPQAPHDPHKPTSGRADGRDGSSSHKNTT